MDEQISDVEFDLLLSTWKLTEEERLELLDMQGEIAMCRSYFRAVMDYEHNIAVKQGRWFQAVANRLAIPKVFWDRLQANANTGEIYRRKDIF